MSQRFTRLADLRRQLLGYEADFVADLTGIPLARLAALEDEETRPTIGECRALSGVYGVEPRLLAQRPLDVAPEHGVSFLAQSPEFRSISPTSRAAIVRAATVARQVVDLEGRLGRPGRFQQFNAAFRQMQKPPGLQAAHQEGRAFAEQVRRTLGVKGPIASMRDFVSTHFPSVLVLFARLGDDELGGVALADGRRGPTIILNVDGRNENPMVRRFSLGHELCHLLVDWNRMQPLALISAVREDARLDVERRANAFAVRLLFPERAALALRDTPPAEALRRALHRWGLHFRAARLHLQHAAGFNLVDLDAARATVDDPDWGPAEAVPELSDFPVEAVPPERRTVMARLAGLAFLQDMIDVPELARLLGLPVPDDDALLAVLAHVGLDADACRAQLASARRRRPLRGVPLQIGADFDTPVPEWADLFGV